MERRHRNIVSRNGPESKSAFEPYIKPIRLTSQLTSCHQIWQNQLFTQHPSLMCTATNPYKGRARSPRRHQVGGFYFLLRVRLSARKFTSAITPAFDFNTKWHPIYFIKAW